MRHLAWTVALGCLGLCAGCGHPKPVATADPAPVTVPPSEATPATGAKDPVAVPTQPGDITANPVTPDAPKTDDMNLAPGVKHVPSGKVPPLSKQGWHRSKMSSLDLAAKIDKTFWNLTGAAADIRSQFVLPIGSGQMKLDGKFDGDRFSVSYPVIEGQPPHPLRIIVVGNGGMMTEFHPNGGKGAYSPKHSYKPGGSMDGAGVLAEWPTEMPRLALSHFITGKDVFVPLVKALQAPESGFSVTAEERTSTLSGKYYHYYRIHASRIDPKTKQSLAEYEILVDPIHFLPLTMRTHVTSPGKNAIIQEWAGRWTDLKVNPSDFKLRN